MTVTKTFNPDNPYAGMSSISNELACIEKFSRNGTNPYAPKILSVNKDSYVMSGYKLPLGSMYTLNGNHVRRVLFSITSEELLRQLDEILNILEQEEIQHRDIHPRNILFCEKDRHLKLIDFYWGKTGTISPVIPRGLGRRWGRTDKIAVNKIKSQLKPMFTKIEKQIDYARELTKDFGHIYYDGSASLPGKTYHEVDIPYFKEHEFHRSTRAEFNKILSSISIEPKSVIDIGCAAGYNIFNLMRNFKLDSAIAYEADPLVFNFLSHIKKYFCLKELELVHRVYPNTEFEPVDLVICMNIHMWLVKQFGVNDSNEIISNLIRNSKEMFFQTASAESNGKYKVKWLKTREMVGDFLKELGGQRVTFIKTMRRRHLFKVSKEEGKMPRRKVKMRKKVRKKKMIRRPRPVTNRPARRTKVE